MVRLNLDIGPTIQPTPIQPYAPPRRPKEQATEEFKPSVTIDDTWMWIRFQDKFRKPQAMKVSLLRHGLWNLGESHAMEQNSLLLPPVEARSPTTANPPRATAPGQGADLVRRAGSGTRRRPVASTRSTIRTTSSRSKARHRALDQPPVLPAASRQGHPERIDPSADQARDRSPTRSSERWCRSTRSWRPSLTDTAARATAGPADRPPRHRVAPAPSRPFDHQLLSRLPRSADQDQSPAARKAQRRQNKIDDASAGGSSRPPRARGAALLDAS